MAILQQAPKVEEGDRRQSLREDESLKSLVRSLALAEGFSLHILVYSPAGEVPLVLDVVGELLAGRGREVAWTHINPSELSGGAASEDGLESSIPLRLAEERSGPPDEGEIVVLHAEAIHAAQRGLWAGVFHRMNRARNLIVKRLRAPLLLVMAPETEALFAEAAPDFWSGRSGVYRVAHIPEPTRLVGDDMFYDVSSFVDVLSAHASRVCRVDSGGTRRGYATGFLVGPDVVLTTYNIMQEVIEHPAQISAVRLRFGYQRDRDGKINAGTEYHLATDWLIDVSPYDTLDDTLAPNRRPGDELGYALLRVADSPGSSLSSPGGTQPRGWIPLPSAAALEPGAPLFMLHHPSGGPLKLSLNTQSVLDVSTSETIVRYTTNTLAGSGGAPCFDAHWNLVAMHQGSGSNDNDDWHNEGIHITAIRKLLQARGKLALIEQHARVAPFVSPPGKR